MGVAYVRFAVDNPAHYRVMFGGFVHPEAAGPDVEPDAELVAQGEGAFGALVDALAALQRDALVRGDDTVLVARYVWALVHGVAMLAIDGQLHESGAVDALLSYALDRLQTALAG
jgi:hypothetical protein